MLKKVVLYKSRFLIVHLINTAKKLPGCNPKKRNRVVRDNQLIYFLTATNQTMKTHTIIIACSLLVGCSGTTELPQFDTALNKDPASVVIYNDKDTNHLFLTDYLPTIVAADSITSDAVEIIKTKDGWAEFDAIVTPSTEWLSTINVWKDGKATTLIASKNEVIPTRLTYKGKAEKVSLVGQMTAWRRDVMNFKSDDNVNWTIDFALPAGQYQYLIAVDDNQILDPTNATKEGNGNGGFNSLLKLVGVDPALAPVISTYQIKDDKLLVMTNSKVDKVVVTWQNVALPQSMVAISDKMITIQIPSQASAIDRSWLRVWASNSNGVSNDLLVPMIKGKIVTSAQELDRHDKHRNILYSLMIDRFKNGNTANDRSLDQADVLPIVDYMGGDIAGITQKINDGFFTDLGINTIWVSPITQNPYNAWGLNAKPVTKFSGYHGYWPIYITSLDARFGNDTELRQMLDAAHAKGINVILDYVANHIHIDSPTLKTHPDWTTPATTPDGRPNLELWDEFRLTTWFDKHIPTLDLERVEIYEPLTDSALYWIANYDFDGFRHDATKHIPEVYWRTLTQKMKSRYPEKSLYQIGETYGSPELINSYIKSGMLDGQFDFNIYDAATGAIALPDGSMSSLAGVIQNSLDTYGYHNLMGNITGNHDRPRYISLAGGALSFAEDSKAAGWNRTITVGDSSSYDKLSLLEALMFTIPGVPTVYQGDEYGVPGGNDPDNRRMMNFDGYNPKETIVKEKVKKLAALRTNNMALIYGDMMPLYSDESVMVFARNYLGNIALVGINKSDKEQTVDVKLPLALDLNGLSANFGNALTINGENVKMTLAPLSYEVATK